MGNMIKHFRKAAGLTQQELADATNYSKSQIIKLERGERRLSDVVLDRISPILNVTKGQLLGEDANTETDALNISYKVRAHAHTGHWCALNLSSDLQEKVTLPTGKHPHAANFHVIQATDTSMNKVGIQNGSYVVCVVKHMVTVPIQSGDFLVCIRKNTEGLFETTIRQLEILADGSHWLWPRSDDPRYQQPVEIKPLAETPRSLDTLSPDDVYIDAAVMAWLPSFQQA